MMKQGSAAGGGTAVSGKDKAKLLKMMKEQQKQKEVPPVVPKIMKVVAPPAKMPTGIPTDFFDAPQAPLTAKPVVWQPAKAAPATISNNNSNNTISNLPQGFFDNPVEDLNARGITMEQYTAKLEKEEQSALDSFLTDLKGLEGERNLLEEASELQAEGNREYEEEARQMAYMANLIALRAQSERLTNHSGTEETNEVLDQLLKEVGPAVRAEESSTSAASAVDSILYQKLAQNMANKRKRSVILNEVVNTTGTSNASTVNATARSDDEPSSGEGSDNSDSGSGSGSESDSEDGNNNNSSAKKAKTVKYSPLNYMDWMSRSV